MDYIPPYACLIGASLLPHRIGRIVVVAVLVLVLVVVVVVIVLLLPLLLLLLQTW